jgi:hypothetical protein
MSFRTWGWREYKHSSRVFSHAGGMYSRVYGWADNRHGDPPRKEKAVNTFAMTRQENEIILTGDGSTPPKLGVIKMLFGKKLRQLLLLSLGRKR